jgi:hypothetical protein
MRKLIICMLGLPLALSGCVTAEELAAQRAEFTAQVASADDSECRSYGAEQGTPVYVECRMIKDQQRAQALVAAQAASARQFNCGLGMMAAGMSHNPEDRAAMVASSC